MNDGGYDEGYKACPCFWGTEPAEMVKMAIELYAGIENKSVLDFGCGEGKNAAAMARAGFRVVAIDKSEAAIRNAMLEFNDVNVNWLVCDLTEILGPPESYDLVIATGSLHCLNSPEAIRAAVTVMQQMTKISGINVLSSFNDGPQDMTGHSPTFRPTLLPHICYTKMYDGWDVLQSSTEIQRDVHPHNEVNHSHSITRLLAKRVK